MVFSVFVEKTEKTDYNKNGVITMRASKEMLRLQASDKIGNRHIAVKRQVYCTYPQHWHNYFELEIVAAGEGIHILNGEAYQFGKGDVYLLTPIDFHEIETTSYVEIINISFDDIWLPEDTRSFLYAADYAKKQHFEGNEYDRLVVAAELLRHEYESDALCVDQLLNYILSRFLLHNIKKTEGIATQEQLTGIKKAVAHIEMHFREKITLEFLADISGYSSTYFSELFKKVTGETYLERVTSLRINYAKGLLARGLPVSDACFESGFGSLSNFLTAFKAKCDMTPSQYRLKCKKTY